MRRRLPNHVCTVPEAEEQGSGMEMDSGQGENAVAEEEEVIADETGHHCPVRNPEQVLED